MNKLVEVFEKEKRWINWSFKNKTKVPHGSSTDENTWSTYAKLDKTKPIGIIFTPDCQLLGIDIDHCLEQGVINHADEDKIRALLDIANTYTEISPSGTGLHLFLKITEPLHLVTNKKAPFEVYTKGRFFTVTKTPFGTEKNVRIVNLAEAQSILSIIGYPWGKKVTAPAVASTESVSLTYDPLEKAFSSKNGETIKDLYNGNVSQYGDDESSADMALCAHLAFWTQKNALEMERLWVASPLGQRKKTQSRQDYRTRTINAAIANCKEVYTPLPPPPKDLDLLFTYKNKDKVYTLNTENVCRVLNYDFKGQFRYDLFKNVFEMCDGGKWRVLEDNDAVVIQTKISILYTFFQKVGKDMVYDAIMKVSKDHAYDSASDFIKSIKWDGTKRLDSWLTTVYGTPNDKYHIAVGSNWIKGLVKRIIEPGCKFDYVLVLEGEQGVKKSTSLGILGGDWHVETTMSTDSKDFFMQFAGKAIIEFSEGETLSRTEVKRMKAIITMQSDKYRPPYERVSKDFPRRCVFAMTTNQTEYLKDETGNRRWLPVTVMVPEANIEWLAENRNQLFAEAYHRVFNLKETIYEFPKEETLAAQNARRITDPNADLVSHWYSKLDGENKKNGITIYQVYRDALNGGHVSKPMSKYDEMCIATILKDTLLLEKIRVMHDGVRAMRWYPPGTPRLEMALDFRSEADKAFDSF